MGSKRSIVVVLALLACGQSPAPGIEVDAAAQASFAASWVTQRLGGGAAPGGAAVRRAGVKTASVLLPARANEAVTLEDNETHTKVKFSLRDAVAAPPTTAKGLVTYPGALHGADVVHRVRADGTEDFVAFESRPAKEEIVYDLDVSAVAGLRLVSDTLELLDGGGTPRLRVAPPYVVAAHGARVEATLSVAGCAYDTSPAAPWGRAVTPPGASSCSLHVAWSGASYPAMVDPQWTTTGSMATARARHTATLLQSGKVLVAGGTNGAAVASAELYDLGTHVFAATGTLNAARSSHAATLLASGQVLLTGGLGTAALSSAELYDPATGQFSKTGSMTSARTAHTATLLQSGKVLVVGGCSSLTAELFSGGSFTAITGHPQTAARASHGAVLLASGDVLITGGFPPNVWPQYALASSEVYQVASGAFVPSGSMASARGEHSSVLLPSGRVLVVGGWTQAGDTTNLVTVTVGQAEIYDAGAFTTTGALSVGRMGQTASLLPSNQVLVAGGSTNTNAELYDVASGTFGAGGSLNASRAYQTATMFPTGEVLVAGGKGSTYEASAELYTLPDASSCTVDADCASGFCTDGYCCSTACSAQCEACDIAGSIGTCSSVMSGPSHGSRTPCTCNGGVCESGATCTNDHTSTGVGGQTDCSPYKCNQAGDGSCLQSCRSVDDCVAPNVCDSTGACGAPSGGSSGCSLGPSGPPDFVWIAAAWIALATLRRRRT